MTLRFAPALIIQQIATGTGQLNSGRRIRQFVKRYPAMRFALAECGPKQGIIRCAHNRDLARHVEQFQEQSLLGQRMRMPRSRILLGHFIHFGDIIDFGAVSIVYGIRRVSQD